MHCVAPSSFHWLREPSAPAAPAKSYFFAYQQNGKRKGLDIACLAMFVLIVNIPRQIREITEFNHKECTGIGTKSKTLGVAPAFQILANEHLDPTSHSFHNRLILSSCQPCIVQPSHP